MGIYEIEHCTPKKFQLNHLRHLTDVFIIPNNLYEYTIIHTINVSNETTHYLLGFNETRSHFIAYSLLNGQVMWRLKPDLTIYPVYHTTTTTDNNDSSNNSNLNNLTIEKFLFNTNQTIMIVSYGLELACVFLIDQLKHVGNLNEAYATTTTTTSQTLQSGGKLNSAPNLSIAAISHDGYWLVHTEFSEEYQCTCLTVWSLINFHENQLINQQQQQQQELITWNRKRLLKQTDLLQVAISGQHCVIVAARLNYGLLCWCPCNHNEQQTNSIHLQNSENLNFSIDNPPLLNVSMDGSKIISASGLGKCTQITIWQLDLNKFSVCFIGSVCCLDQILELQLTKKQKYHYICLSTMNSNKPLLIDPHWMNEIE
ncbi:unnamed protein product [Schistosoma turkestanicum]|nr:unnamed protein product [Schistosoma turkestanicum]